jgi:hypothetical protein
MLEVVAQRDGRFAVCEVGGASGNPLLGVFSTEREADEWMLQRTMLVSELDDGLSIMLPGGNQGLA